MVRKNLPRNRGDFDHATMGEAWKGPGNDTRQWVSYGIVEAQQAEDEVTDPVEFDPDYGPLVSVTLEPSRCPVRCRVAASAAGAVGNGEGEYSPFVEGDEVIVMIPEGNEMADCVIFGRLNNALDRFPTNVGGQDPSANKFAFQRRRTPYVQEWSSTWMQRIASHGAFILISESGAWTIRDGAKGALQIGPDIFGFTEGLGEVVEGDDTQTPTPTALFQLDLTGRRFTIQMDDAQFMLNSSDADNLPGAGFLTLPAEMNLIIGTNAAQEHVATIEAVAALLEVALTNIGLGAGIPALAALAAALAAGGAPLAAMAVPLATGLVVAAAVPKLPVAAVPGVQLLPGLGAVLFKTG